MKRPAKEVEIKARVDLSTKQQIEKIAAYRGESVSVIVRESIGAYLGVDGAGRVLYNKAVAAEENMISDEQVDDLRKRVVRRAPTVLEVSEATIYRDIPLGDAPAGLPTIGEIRDTISVDMKAHPQASFALRVRGESMTGVAINDGDVLLFASPEEVEPVAGKVVTVVIDGEVTIKTLVKINGKSTLRAENPAYPNPVLTRHSAIQGVMVANLGKV